MGLTSHVTIVVGTNSNNELHALDSPKESNQRGERLLVMSSFGDNLAGLLGAEPPLS